MVSRSAALGNMVSPPRPLTKLLPPPPRDTPGWAPGLCVSCGVHWNTCHHPQASAALWEARPPSRGGRLEPRALEPSGDGPRWHLDTLSLQGTLMLEPGQAWGSRGGEEQGAGRGSWRKAGLWVGPAAALCPRLPPVATAHACHQMLTAKGWTWCRVPGMTTCGQKVGFGCELTLAQASYSCQHLCHS